MDKNRVNDDEEYNESLGYIGKETLSSYKFVPSLSKSERKDANLILSIAKNKNFNYPWRLLSAVDKSILNTDFVISYVKILYDKGVLGPNSIQPLCRSLPSDFLDGNKKFWDAMIELGLAKHEIFEKSELGDLKRRERKITDLMSKIDTVSIEEFMKLTNDVYRSNPQFMLDVISKNPALYVCSSEKLITDPDFNQLLISEVPEIETIIEKSEQVRKIQYEQKEKEKQEKRLEAEHKREEMKMQKKLEEKNKLIAEYQEQGEEHPNLILVNDFLESNMSKGLFCKTRNITMEKLDEAIKEVPLIYPEIGMKIAKKNEQTTAIYLSTIDGIIDKLLSGEMTLEQYSRENFSGIKIDDLLHHITELHKRKQFHSLTINTIASGNLRMMDYMRLFSEKHDYRTIINNINQYIKIATKEVPELQGKDKPINKANLETKSLRKYSEPFQSKKIIGSSKGFKNAEGQMVMVPITEEHINYAKKDLQLKDEYICQTTMNSTLSKLVKGEITFEEIDKKIAENTSMRSFVTNAINKGIATEHIQHYDTIQQSNSKENSTKGEIIDGQ